MSRRIPLADTLALVSEHWSPTVATKLLEFLFN